MTKMMEIDPESAIVSACLHPMWPYAIGKAKALLQPSDFTDDGYRLLYEAMVELSNRGEPVDLVTLGKYLEYPTTGILLTAAEISVLPVVPSSIPYYAKTILDNNLQVEIQKISDNVELSAEDKLRKVNEFKIKKESEIGTLFDDAGLRELLNSFDAPELQGAYYKSGIDSLDKIIVGFQPGTVTAIQGLYKSGKTKLLIQILCQALKDNIPVGFLSLEMSRQRVRNWVLSHLCNIDSLFFNNPQHGRWNNHRAEYCERIADQMPRLGALSIYVSDVRRPSIDQVTKIISEWVRKGVGLVGLDYFERMETGVDWKDEGVVTAKLADAAATHDIALIYIDQLNKEAERGQTTSWAYSRGSTARNADADLILQIVNKSRKKRQQEVEKMAMLEMSIMGREVPSGIQLPIAANLAIGKFAGQADERI